MGYENKYPSGHILDETLRNTIFKKCAGHSVLQQRNKSAPQASSLTPVLPQSSSGGCSMTRRFEGPNGRWIEFRVRNGILEHRDHVFTMWGNIGFVYNNDINVAAKNILLTSTWKEVLSGFDPNDLQGQDGALWGANSKPCCGGGTNGGFFIQGKWHDINCDATKPPPQELLPGYSVQPSSLPQPKNLGRCTCGSSAVGSDRHSDYCDIK